MKNYVIMRNKQKEIISLLRYDSNKFPIESIKDKIKTWSDDTQPELIEDAFTIEILNFIYRNDDNFDLQKRAERMECALEEIANIIRRF